MATFLGFLTKKYQIFDGSKFFHKSHNNLWCLLFPTTWIVKRQFAQNENWLRIFEWKFMLFDKWLRTFERNFAPYLLCLKIPVHFVDDNLPSSNLLRWFFSDVTSQCKLYDKLMSVYTTGSYIYETHLYYFKGSVYCLLHVKSIAALTPLFFGGSLTTRTTHWHRPCLRNPDSARTGFCTQSFCWNSCGNHAKSFQLHANMNRAFLQARPPPSWEI